MSDEDSDEDESGSHGFVRHSPIWRSDTLNMLVTTLDARYEAEIENTLKVKPSEKRTMGDASSRPVPFNAPTWAIAAGGERPLLCMVSSEIRFSGSPTSSGTDID